MGVFSRQIWTLVLKRIFTTKDPPCIAIVQFLLIKCPQQIRKFIVDTSVLLKYSLANNVNDGREVFVWFEVGLIWSANQYILFILFYFTRLFIKFSNYFWQEYLKKVVITSFSLEWCWFAYSFEENESCKNVGPAKIAWENCKY